MAARYRRLRAARRERERRVGLSETVAQVAGSGTSGREIAAPDPAIYKLTEKKINPKVMLTLTAGHADSGARDLSALVSAISPACTCGQRSNCSTPASLSCWLSHTLPHILSLFRTIAWALLSSPTSRSTHHSRHARTNRGKQQRQNTLAKRRECTHTRTHTHRQKKDTARARRDLSRLKRTDCGCLPLTRTQSYNQTTRARCRTPAARRGGTGSPS